MLNCPVCHGPMVRTSFVRVDGPDVIQTAVSGLLFGFVTMCFGGVGVMGFAISGMALLVALLNYLSPDPPTDHCPKCLAAAYAKDHN